MRVEPGMLVTLPRFAPYPRHGRVEAIDADGVVVAGVQCGDPRCATEHVHGKETWPLDLIESAGAYQPRAPWEYGRKTSPNAPIV